MKNSELSHADLEGIAEVLPVDINAQATQANIVGEDTHMKEAEEKLSDTDMAEDNDLATYEATH